MSRYIRKRNNTWAKLGLGTPGAKGTTDVLGTSGGTTLPTPTASGLLSVDQGSPQKDATSWIGIGATVSRSAVGATVGQYALTMTPGGAGQVQLTPAVQPMTLPTNASEVTLKFFGVSSAGVGRPTELMIDWFSDSGWVSRTGAAAVTLTGTAQTLTYVAAVPTGVTAWKPVMNQGVSAGNPQPADVVTIGEIRADVTKTSSTGAGTGTGSGSGTGVVTPPAGTRLARWQSFKSSSPVNLPLVEGLRVGAGLVDVPSLRSTTAWVNCVNYSHGVVYAQASDPFVTCTDTVHGNWSIQVQIPSWAQPSSGTDRHLEVVSPDGSKITEMFACTRDAAGNVKSERIAVVDLLGTGLGPQSGVRAWGGSAIAGLIRTHEVTKTHPMFNAAYPIQHPVAIAIDVNQLGKDTARWNATGAKWGYYSDGSVTNALDQPGHNPGKNRNGYGSELGYVWPATEQDYNSMSNGWYGGSIPMGALFAIPSDVTNAQLGIATEQGAWLANACRDYGSYVSDATWGCTAFYVEFQSSTNNALPYADTLTSSGDAKRIRDALRRVVLSNEANPGGGPLNATRRRPLLPEVSKG